LKNKGDAVFSFCLLIFLAVLVYSCFSYNPTARLIPLALGIFGLSFSGLQFLLEVSPAISEKLIFLKKEGDIFSVQEKAKSNSLQKDDPTEVNWLQVLRIFLWLLAFLVLLNFTYPLVVIPLFIFLFLVLESRERWIRSLGIAAGVGVFVYLLFSLLLGIF